MTRNVLFLMTHVGSGWESLASRLEGSPRIRVFRTGRRYSHPDDVRSLLGEPHGLAGAAALWVDVLLHNKDFAMRGLCGHYKMLFWSRSFAESDLSEFGDRAAAYYDVRLRGMTEYYGRKPGSLWNPVLEGEALFDAVL